MNGPYGVIKGPGAAAIGIGPGIGPAMGPGMGPGMAGIDAGIGGAYVGP